MRIARCRKDTLYIYNDRHDVEATRIIKSLTKRKFHREPTTHWTAPLTMDNVVELQTAGFTIDKTLQRWMDDLFFTPVFDPDFNIPGLPAPLLQYQKEGIQMIDQLNGRALLADDPGLGKSVQFIAWCKWRNQEKILIFCPAFAKYNWQEEIEYWTGETDVQIISGLSQTEITAKWVIVNYDILLDKEGLDVREDLFDVEWSACCVDEAHYISNPHALRTLAVKAINAGVPHVVPMSATPGKNRPADLFTAINMVNDKVFPSFLKYGRKYCKPKMVHGKWEYKGSSNEKELNTLLKQTVMIRRTKNEVFQDLPDRIRIPVLLEGGTEFVSRDDISLNSFERMKQNAVKAKMDSMIKWIWNLLETEDKIIIFGEHKITMDALWDAFKDIAVRVDGTVSSTKARKEAVNKFQRCARCGVKKEYHNRDKKACKEYVVDLSTRVFLGSRAAKESGTLTAANDTIFTELWWSLEDHKQAEDRAFGRAGDLHGTRNWYLIAKGTIEEEIANIISLKDRRVSMMMNGKKVRPDLLLSELIKRYKEKSNESKK